MSQVQVLVVDAGGRGNAIAHSLARSPRVSKVEVAPGNAGSSLLEKCRQLPKVKTIDEIVEHRRKNNIDLVIVGPEGFLEDGLVNAFYDDGFYRVVGPTKEAAVLETSKCRTKDFLEEINVPTQYLASFTDAKEAKQFAADFCQRNPDRSLVMKLDGTYAGKGTFLPNTLEQLLSLVDAALIYKRFGKVGEMIEFEENISRRKNFQEIMYHVVTDGSTVLPIGAAMDYKMAFDKDDLYHHCLFDGVIPNTGGMGGYFPHPLLVSNPGLDRRIMEEIVEPTITNFKERRKIRYKGTIYFGLMVYEEDGNRQIAVAEINARWGDPEAETILPALRTDFYDLCDAIVEERLNEFKHLEWDQNYYVSICAVSGTLNAWSDCVGDSEKRLTWLRKANGRWIGDLVFPGYPGRHITGQIINGLDNLEPDTLVYHNGTAFSDKKVNGRSQIVTSGGRVLTLTVKGPTLEVARSKAYSEMKKISFTTMRYRHSIGV